MRQGSGSYWNGSAFSSSSEVFLLATGTTSWSYGFDAASFPADGTYTVRTRAVDVAGNVQSPISRSFTYDKTAPTISKVTPQANASGVARTVKVTVQFNEAMDAASITTTSLVLRDPLGNIVPATVTYSATSPARTATLTPSAPLTAGTTYAAAVLGGAGGVTDTVGNPLATTFSWSFKTT